MCLSSAPAAPTPPPALPEAPRTPDVTASVGGSADARRRAAAAGASSTILTGTRGVSAQAQTGAKTLLGQ